MKKSELQQIIKEEFKRIQRLAGITEENESPQLTTEEKSILEEKIENFLGETIFSSDILANDSENFNPTREERAIQFVIDTLQERISRY